MNVLVGLLQKIPPVVMDPGAGRDLAHIPHFTDKEYREIALIVHVYTGELE